MRALLNKSRWEGFYIMLSFRYLTKAISQPCRKRKRAHNHSAMTEVVSFRNQPDILNILAKDVTFHPPTYYNTGTSCGKVATDLSRVNDVFSGFSCHQILGGRQDSALELICKVSPLDGVGVGLLTLNDRGLISTS